MPPFNGFVKKYIYVADLIRFWEMCQWSDANGETIDHLTWSAYHFQKLLWHICTFLKYFSNIFFKLQFIEILAYRFELLKSPALVFGASVPL